MDRQRGFSLVELMVSMVVLLLTLAGLTIEASPEDTEFLRSFGEQLPFLFITSEIQFGPVGADAFRSTSVPGLAIQVASAPGDKCVRCWNYTTDVGAESEWPEICARCAGHVRAGLSET